MKNKNKVLKILISIFILVISFFMMKYISFTALRDKVLSYGKLAPLVYIVLFSILPIFFFPVPVLALVAGLLFGVFYGTVYTVIAVVINSSLMYYLGRFLGRDYVQGLIEGKMSKNLRTKLLSENQKSLTGVFFALRLVPLVSYNIINYVSGFTKISYKNYIFSTVLGVIPGTVVFLNVGDKSLKFMSPEFVRSIIYLVILSLISAIFLKLFLREEKRNA